ncbi:helix-turn-helix transcriptional regulator [Niabella beijingensis]|uniref:helix-turn-helix transcriptional regulator n=1 Tax=Niabella beijingensis TaxID=2872700 RepID=UPI001CC02D7A|nr:helix-turn-helix transcriptional regulator [Niabella beijingensis]MBZ4188106.1 helix-turn-helix transcriptional regulator [Niabella beijingensis]
MKTAFFLPPEPVSDFVSGILVIEDVNAAEDFVIPLFANGFPTLIFQSAAATKDGNRIGHLTLYGQTIRPAELVLKEGFSFIAYFFYPQYLKQLFNINPKEITDDFADLKLLKKAGERELEAKLLEAASLGERLRLIDDYIVKLAGGAGPGNEKLVFATGRLMQTNGLYALTDLQQELYITERSFQRLFENNIGITPNLYRRICQFQFAFQQVNRKKILRLTDVAYNSGFADQSHFIKVFKEFTGITPKEYLEKVAPYNPEF